MDSFDLIDEEKYKEYDRLLRLLGFDLKDMSDASCKLLTQMAQYKKALHLRTMDAVNVHAHYTDLLLSKIDTETHILSLEQFVRNADKQIEREKRLLENFKIKLRDAKEKLDIVIDPIDFQGKKLSNEIKLETYQEKLHKLQGSLQKYHIPPEIDPENIKCLESDIKQTYEKRNRLKNEVDKIKLLTSARKDLSSLKFK